MLVVDASVMVSVFWSGDVNHEESRRWLKTQTDVGETFVAPILLVGEASGAITRRTNNQLVGHTIRENMQAMPAFTLLPVTDEIGLYAAWLAVELRIHGADAIYVAIADLLHAPLASWDNQQRDRASTRINVIVPKTGRSS